MLKLVVFVSSFLLCRSMMGDEEMKMDFIKTVMNCTASVKVDPSKLATLRKKILPDDPGVRCLLACAYNNWGLLDDKGMMSMEGAEKIFTKYSSGNPDKIKKFKEFALECIKERRLWNVLVNEVVVSEGDSGCERAGLIFKCIVDNSPKYGIKI